MCGLEKEMLSQLLCSVLPAELAIEAMNKKEGKSTMTVTWERFQGQGVTKEMAVFEAKDHNQTFNRTGKNVSSPKIRTF